MMPFLTDQSRWEAVQKRDESANGQFVYAVVTTGVYCRPVCRSRPPKRENVQFFTTTGEAEAAGFRPCKRCQPQAEQLPHHQAIHQACQLLEQAAEPLTLPQLAEQVGLSPTHLQKMFKKIVGISPKQYAEEKRHKRLQQKLQEPNSVTEAVYAAGFNSSSRLYAQAPAVLGMTPTRYQKGGAGLEIYSTVGRCYLGFVLVAATVRGICLIQLGDTPAELQEKLVAHFPQATFVESDPQFGQWVQEVVAFLEHPAGRFSLPLDIQGTAFQRRVWQALQAIPAGATASYGEIAKQVGNEQGGRAVAQACAANPVAVAIPCHRVIRHNGDLGGYRWGVGRKKQLLEREQALVVAYQGS